MRLVHDQHTGAIAIGLLDQQCIECKQNVRLRFTVALQIEVVSHHFEKLLGGKTGVEDEGEFRPLRVEDIPQTLEHGRFAGAYFTRKDDKSAAAPNAIGQIGKRLFVLWTSVEKLRVRADIKRVFGKSKVRVIDRILHPLLPFKAT